MLIAKSILLLVFLIGCNGPFVSTVIDKISRGRWLSLIIYMGIWGLCLLATYASAFYKKFSVRVVLGFMLGVSAAFGMSYLNIGGHFLNYMDMELLWISRGHTLSAVSFYMNEITLPIILGLLGWLAVLLPSSHRPRNILSVTIPLPYLVLSTLTFVKAGYGTSGMPQHYSALSTFFLLQAYENVSEGMVEVRRPIVLKPKAKGFARNVILIVDESIRSDMLDINGSDGITPYLLSQKNRLVNLGTASSANNCSGYSNAVLRMGGIRGKLKKIGSNPFIWSYAKMAGYKTWYLDAQLKRGELQNFMSAYETEEIEHLIQFDETPEPMLDQVLAKKVVEVLKSPGKNFLYLNKRGAHFPYSESYDTERVPFSPQMMKGDKLGESREKLVNSYMNAIFWNTDKFFEILFAAKLDDSFIVYTSDHGQNLMDSGIQTHCNTESPHPNEGKVPLFVIPNEENLELANKWREANFNMATHFQIFPSLLEAMGYDLKEVIEEYGPGLETPSPWPQEFSAGPVLPKFGKEVDWNSIEVKK